MSLDQKTIKVTVDKSHLLTLGERMYVESIELIRELVNNAYDADATDVRIDISDEKIVIEDNGSGMNEKGLEQFFTIGSEEKRIHSVSPRFGRKRIGQFGIGKFAALAASDRFVVESRKGKWLYKVVFDREDWQKTNHWHLPIIKIPIKSEALFHRHGTKVVLDKLKKKFSLGDVERHLRDAVPLRAKKFSVYLNNKKVAARYIPGRRFLINFKTIYGSIEGEIVIALNSKLVDNPGIECRVKQVLVRYEFFGLDKLHYYGLNRITGSVNVDFLPILADRINFVQDSPEYHLFAKLMRHELEKILKDLKKEQSKKYLQKINKELKEIMAMIRGALEDNPELMPSGRTVTQKAKRRRELVESIAAKVQKAQEEKIRTKAGATEEKEVSEKGKVEKKALPKPEITKQIRIKKLGISVGIVSLGEDGPEAISEGNLVYINQDHPLYQKLYQSKDKLMLHLLRLISQEIVLMQKKRIPAREAFEIQSKIITAAMK